MKQAKPRLFFSDDQPWCPSLTVYEEAAEPIDTGVLDVAGTKIFRRPERHAVGFDLRRTKQ